MKDKKYYQKKERKQMQNNVTLRALALGNANAKCKENLAFVAPKCSTSENCKAKYCKFFCNTATVQF